MDRHGKLPASWATDEPYVKQIGRTLMKHLGPAGSLLMYPDPTTRKPRWWIVRFLDGPASMKTLHPETGELVDHPRPWTRPLEILGSASSLGECYFILQGGKCKTMVGLGLRPVRNREGEWTGVALPAPSQLQAAIVRDRRSN